MKAKLLQRFFKTGRGEYGAGDVFLGLSVPEQRKIALKHLTLPLSAINKLLHSKIHEFRLCALEIIVARFERAESKTEKQQLYNFYLKNRKYINNWDLVDLSAPYVPGAFLYDRPKGILSKLARSKNIWDRRIAIISTFYFITRNKFMDALKIATLLRHDQHDLIQKATGWMLREIGKRSLKTELTFLNKFAATMPRTMLRYAIERFPEKTRQKYLNKKRA